MHTRVFPTDEREGHQKRDSAESQPFVNLKSNTMKNTLQR